MEVPFGETFLFFGDGFLGASDGAVFPVVFIKSNLGDLLGNISAEHKFTIQR